VSTIVGSRIYSTKAPQGASLPHIVITQMDSDEMGALDDTPGLRSVDFDIDCKADRAVTSYTLGNAVRVFVDDASGTAGDQTIGAVYVNSETTDYEPPSDGSDKGIHNTLIDVTIQYTPA
jgi:hypothetical protein